MKEKDFELSEEKAIEIGKFLKEKRIELGYSTNQILLKTGISKGDLSRIENGKKKKINPIYLKELCKVLKLDVIDIFKKVDFLDDKALARTKQKDLIVNKGLDSRGRRQLSDIMEETSLMFNDEDISDEDKEKVMLAIQEAFFIAKQKNKRKK